MLKKLFLLMALFNVMYGGSRFAVNVSPVDSEMVIDLDVASIIPAFGENSYFLGAGVMGIGQDPVTFKSLYQLYSMKFFMEMDVAPFEDIRIEIGAKAIYTNINGRDYWALPLGASTFYKFSEKNIHPIVRGSVFYGPAHFTFNNAKDYLEYRMGVGLQIDNIRQFLESGLGQNLSYFHVYLEYRSVHTNYITADVSLSETFYGGMKVAF